MKKHGCLWWLCISWWWLPIKWVCYSIPAFILRIIAKILAVLKARKKPSTPITRYNPQKPQSTAQANVKTYEATGMSYRLEGLLSLGYENEDYSKNKKQLIDEDLTEQRIYEYFFHPRNVELIPEPTNQYDPKAIKVVVDGVHVAYIKAGSCAHLLKLIHEDRAKVVGCKIGGGKYKHISCDYNDEGGETYTMEKGESPYFVWLKVSEE